MEGYTFVKSKLGHCCYNCAFKDVKIDNCEKTYKCTGGYWVKNADNSQLLQVATEMAKAIIIEKVSAKIKMTYDEISAMAITQAKSLIKMCNENKD